MENFWVIDMYNRQNGNKVNMRGIIGTERVNAALDIAFRAHSGRVDRTGRPTIMRAIHVAEQMKGELPVCAALLCDMPALGAGYEALSGAGFYDQMIEIVRILGQEDEIPFAQHCQNVKASGNALAIQIALLALQYDCDLSKFKGVDEQVAAWYAECTQAMAFLEDGNPKNRWQDSDMQYLYDATTSRQLDIKSDAPSIGGRLSNLCRRSFDFCGVACGSIEGVLQSFKFPDPIQQTTICQTHGYQAKKAGKDQDWRPTQTLHWMGESFARDSERYQQLLTALYKAAYDQSEQFREDLARSKGYALLHSIGKDDPKETILTRSEFLSQLERLREEC